MLQKHIHYKYLIFYVTAFVLCFLTQEVLLNRLIMLGGRYYVTGGTFIYFVSPLITDVVAEVYGYQIARQILWLGLFCILFLAVCTAIVIRLPYPPFWQADAHAYSMALNFLFRGTVVGIVAVIIGQFINIYLISKWKILLQGKYFWMRSTGSSIIGDAVTVTISIVFIFWGRVPFSEFSAFLIPELVIMVVFSAAGAVPALFLAKLTAKAEGLNNYDVGVNFNPFAFTIDEGGDKG
ncbi:MAG: hypothetical protein COV52_03165 [Gammaproteobacteria bacterium CG11_big_fil_rev_8_21_14_0_20_46_22]|nr:MAG: hypothetical protein COV52_03165 [Gammaproteobacteria bacterium CG11_big_fil_rev_8_21_14_0_20_46_22]